MDREQIIMQLKQEIRQRFMSLSENEKNIIRQNKETPYAQILRKVLGQELLSGLRVSNNKPGSL
tara:strand:- start:96 stop:287 length:192 start_codon:yes stop_codon:yes gene_type:complete